MFSITATIGRNISTTHHDATLAGQPLTLTQWGTFVEDVKADMHMATAPTQERDGRAVEEIHYGKGVWEGVEEESAKITLLFENVPSGAELRDLRALLTEDASYYGQDAIALTIGTSELV